MLLSLTTSTTATAFCRKTTCKPEETDCATDARGCVTSGNPLVWKKLPLSFRFSSVRPGPLLREEARAAIRAAFYRWSDALCGPDQRRTSLRFVEGEEIPGEKPHTAGAQASEPYGIFFRERGWPYEGKADSTLAQTNTFFGKESGTILYADIEINTGTMRFSTKEEPTGIDLQAVITHEVGHYIGLDHSREPDSIMTVSYCEGETRCQKGKIAARTLADDDLAAVCAIYPPDLDLGADPAPARADCSSGRRPSIPSTPIAGVGAALVIAATWRRRRRSPRG